MRALSSWTGFLFGVAMVTVLSVKTNRAQEVPAQGASSRKFVSKEWRLSVEMPAVPTVETRRTKAGPYLSVEAKGDFGKAAYGVYVIDLPEAEKNRKDPHGAMKAFRDGVYQGKKVQDDTELLRDKKTPGREFWVELETEWVREQMYLDGLRLYRIVVSGPAKILESSGTERFFSSFEIPSGDPDQAPPKNADTDEAWLQGKWTLEKVLSDAPLPYKIASVKFEGKTIEFLEPEGPVVPGGAQPPNGTFRLDAEAKTIDITTVRANGQKEVFTGFYQLGRDHLNLAFAPDTRKRPTLFETVGEYIDFEYYSFERDKRDPAAAGEAVQGKPDLED